jgi:hypothetical protein
MPGTQDFSGYIQTVIGQVLSTPSSRILSRVLKANNSSGQSGYSCAGAFLDKSRRCRQPVDTEASELLLAFIDRFSDSLPSNLYKQG